MRASSWFLAAGCVVVVLTAATPLAFSHCDTLDGPVVSQARSALEKGDVTAVLKWVRAEDEQGIRAAFAKAVAVRGMGNEARDLADTYFFETLVRVHRAGEGAPFDGLRPSGSEREPALVAADKALESGSADDLVRLVKDTVDAGIRARFADVVRKKKHASDSVAAGREYVAAYVEFIHYAERLQADAGSATGPHGGDDHSH